MLIKYLLLESIALWVNSYVKLFDALSPKYYSWKSLACVIHCLLIIYLIANYRPLTWINSFIYMCLTILYDQDYDGSMSPQKVYCFVVYLLEDEQELSLGMLIRLKRIYNFWCSMLILCQLLHVLYTLHVIFIHFMGLTY